MSNLSPLILPTQAYAFASDLAATPTVTFSQSGTLSGVGKLAASVTVAAFTATGAVGGAGGQGSTSLDFGTDAALTATGALEGATSVGFDANATAVQSNLAASVTIAVSESATASGAGQLQGSTSISTIASARAAGTDPSSVSPLLLPIETYRFQPGLPVLRFEGSFGFVANAILTGTSSFPGNLRASTSIADIFTFGAWLQGTGELQASTSIGFTAGGKLAQNKLFATESVDFSTDATLSAKGQLQGATTVGFSTDAQIDLTRNLAASTSIGFTDDATLTGKGELRGATTIRFLNPGQLLRNIAGSATVSWIVSATLSEAPVPLVPQTLMVKPEQTRMTVIGRTASIGVKSSQRRIAIR